MFFDTEVRRRHPSNSLGRQDQGSGIASKKILSIQRRQTGEILDYSGTVVRSQGAEGSKSSRHSHCQTNIEHGLFTINLYVWSVHTPTSPDINAERFSDVVIQY